MCPNAPIFIADPPFSSMLSDAFGYTFKLLVVDVFLIKIHNPAVAVINLTPLLLLGVVTVKISAPVSAVEPPTSDPPAVANVTSLIM